MITQSLKKINKLKKPYKIIQGSSSAGKTWAILILLIDKAAKSRVIIDVVSMTYDHLRDGAIQDFKDIMQDTGRWFEKRWNKSEHIYRFGNGSMIRFKSMDKPGKAKGPRRDILYVNEANYMSEEIFTQLSVRTKGEVFIDYNPTNRFWAHDYVDRDDTDFIKLTYRDNEFVEEKILNDYAHNREKAKTSDYWANWCRVYLDGEIGILEGVVFQNWKEIDRVPDEATLLGYGMDFGFSADPTT
jgi:phage terminase large subunit